MSELIGQKYILNGEEKSTTDTVLFEKFSNLNNTIYEVIRIEEGIPLFFEDYMERLMNSFESMGAPLSYNIGTIKETILKLIEINNYQSGPVKLIFGLDKPVFFLAFLMKPHLPKDEEYIEGVKTVLLNEERDNPNAKIWNEDLRSKSIHLLENTGAYETILVNEPGNITEASRSNIFFTKGNIVYTTPGSLVLPGITRKKVLEVCDRLNIDVQYENIAVKELRSYNSCFLTGTARKIVPIKIIEELRFDAKNTLLLRISAEFEKLVSEYIQNNKS